MEENWIQSHGGRINSRITADNSFQDVHSCCHASDCSAVSKLTINQSINHITRSPGRRNHTPDTHPRQPYWRGRGADTSGAEWVGGPEQRLHQDNDCSERRRDNSRVYEVCSGSRVQNTDQLRRDGSRPNPEEFQMCLDGSQHSLASGLYVPSLEYARLHQQFQELHLQYQSLHHIHQQLPQPQPHHYPPHQLYHQQQLPQQPPQQPPQLYKHPRKHSYSQELDTVGGGGGGGVQEFRTGGAPAPGGCRMHSTPTRSRRSRGGSVSSSSDPTQDMDRFSLISGLDRISVLSQLSSLERSNLSSTSAASTLDRSASRSSRTSGSLDRMLSGEERFSSLSCHPTPTLRHRKMKSNPKSEPSSPGHSYHSEESAGYKDERTAGCCSMSADEPSYANLNQTKPPAVPSCVKSFMSWMVNKAGKGTTALLDTLPNLSKEDFHIVMIGLDGAGKSTALYRMKFNQYINTVPTIGFNCERIRGTLGKTRGLTFLIWDVGGQEKIRPLWRSYTRCTDGIVFVVDSANSDSFEEAKMELFRTMRYQDNSSVPLLVLANKQDLTSAVSAHQIEEVLGLRDLNSSLWQVEPTCSITGEGLDTGLEALHQLILKKKKLLKRNRNKTK